MQRPQDADETSWVVAGQEQALEDVRRVYEANHEAILADVRGYFDRHEGLGPELRKRTPRTQAARDAATHEGLVAAFAGDTSAHEARIRDRVASDARVGVGFPSWHEALGLAERRIKVSLVQAHPAPNRLTAALAALGRIYDRHIAVVHEQLRITRLAANGDRASAARTSRTGFREFFDALPVPMFVYDTRSLRLLDVNEACTAKVGTKREDLVDRPVESFVAPAERKGLRELLAHLPSETTWHTIDLLRHDGETFTAHVYGCNFPLVGPTARLVVLKDSRDTRDTNATIQRFETQLRQAQKMEAIGRFAGGVAHDFNNLLSVILGYSDMLIADLKADDPVRGDIQEVRQAAQRGADLCRQLLLFSRHRATEPTVIDLNELLKQMGKMLTCVVGADVELAIIAARALGRIRADRGHIEQVVMNLVVNARDAMPKGGKVTVETSNVFLSEEHARTHEGVTAGRYVMLAVSDTGIGMDRETQDHVFEPFFTTKERGKGTGLGLSTVFGIVQQSGGTLWIYSEPGHGTTVKVYLPRVDDAPGYVPIVTPPVTLRGIETILLVEDDDQVRAVVLGILRKSGYHVLEARNAGEAILHCEKYPSVIHLLLTDVVMPQVSGPELATRLLASRPKMKVLCMSGYTEDSVLRHGLVHATMSYLQKPITAEALTQKVRVVLEGTPRTS
jgi:PAS domain S-box-containing protein